jgi:deoxyadenosine/deoxycytidine kinase
LNPPRIIELVGIAGAGKTTLANSLSQIDKRIVLSDHPYFREVRDIPYFARNTLSMTPTLLHLLSQNQFITLNPRKAAWMVILNGWHKTLMRQVASANKVHVMDQGPVSIMAELLYMHPNAMDSSVFKKWWEGMFEAWSGCLDLLVNLDTLDATMIKRVRHRGNWHLIKEQTDTEAADFNQAYRKIYEHLLNKFKEKSLGPRIIKFDSGKESLESIREKVLSFLDLQTTGTNF